MNIFGALSDTCFNPAHTRCVMARRSAAIHGVLDTTRKLTTAVSANFETKATPIPEKYVQIKMVPRTGIEPVTRGFSIRCSTN
jgi:hypothetical protein